MTHPTHPHLDPTYTVVWDYVGGDCGDLPGGFATFDEANRYGEDWVADTLASDEDLPSDGEGSPTFHVVCHVPHPMGGTDHYDEDGKLMYHTPPITQVQAQR